MKDYFKGGGSFTNISLSKFDEQVTIDSVSNNSFVWNSEKVEQLKEKYSCGQIDIKGVKSSPFFDNNINLKKANTIYEYTEAELVEIKLCLLDPIYFIEQYAKFKTAKGYEKVKLRDYQYGIINTFHKERFTILMSSRQSGKTVCSSAYLLYYALFNPNKNVLVLGNILSTAKENMNKVTEMINNLPFFLKPGIKKINESMVEFDNGSRIMSKPTTETAAVGLAINLLYLDEFALVKDHIMEDFYSAVFPTVSAMENSKIIISSTPRGLNLFHSIWMSALEGKAASREGNYFVPIRVDWWQIPGRDEQWKRETVINIGSEEKFNREYGLQFYTGDDKLLDGDDLQKINSIKKNFESRPIECLNMEQKIPVEDGQSMFIKVNYSKYMSWQPKFIQKMLPLHRNDLIHDIENYYILSIDTAKGVGKDYSVINVFKVAPRPTDWLIKNRANIKQDLDIFGLVQVGVFRCNTVNTETFSDIASNLIFDFFNASRVKIVLELNHQGALIRDKIQRHDRFFEDMFIWTKRNDRSLFCDEMGIDLNSHKKKVMYCEKFQYYLSIDRIVPCEKETVSELSNFGASRGGTSYRCETGHDDLAMSCIQVSACLESPQFYSICQELMDGIYDPQYLRVLREQVLDYNTQKYESSGASRSVVRDFLALGF